VNTYTGSCLGLLGLLWKGRGKSDFDLDGRAFDADFVAANCFECGRAEGAASAEIENGAVPWAGYFNAVNLAFAKRTAYVRAAVVYCVKGAADIEEGDFVSAHFDQFGAAGRLGSRFARYVRPLDHDRRSDQSLLD